MEGTDYANLFQLQRGAPERFWLLCSAVLRYALDRINQRGIEITIATCMPPRADGKVRSLRRYVGMGSPPYRGDLHPKNQFWGAESLAGAAIMSRQTVVLSDTQESMSAAGRQGSMAAAPILKEQHIAGALVISASQAHFFSPERLALLEEHVDLIHLAFYSHEYVLATCIDLGIMPEDETQQPYFDSFASRVQAEYRRALREGSMIGITQVEARVRTLLEEELLQLIPSGGCSCR